MVEDTPAQGPRILKQGEVRQHIRETLRTDADLQAFCMVHFPRVAERFADGMDRLQKVNLLLEIADLSEISAQLMKQPQRARAPLRPEPAYRSERSRHLSEELRNLYSARRDLLIAGQDTRVSDEKILAKRRLLREGPQLEPGEHLSMGRYLLLEPLGSGGFARVWKALDETEERLVAIKILHGQWSDERNRIERFQRGARHMIKLQHGGIVRIHSEPQESEGHHFFVMEYLPGGDLRQAIEHRKLTSSEALLIVLRIGEALEFAHRQGLLHRDIKPANILLDGRGDAKLADFDLVWAQDTTGGTGGGAGMGSYNYAAPEAMLDAGHSTVRSDVYSLGMTLFFVLHGSEVPPRLLGNLDGLLRQVPKPVAAVVKTAIAIEPEKRFPTVMAFCEALRVALKSLDDRVPTKYPLYVLFLESTDGTKELVPIFSATFVVGSSGDIPLQISALPAAACRLLYDDTEERLTLEVIKNQPVLLRERGSQSMTPVEERAFLENDDVFLIAGHSFKVLARGLGHQNASLPPVDFKGVSDHKHPYLAIQDDEGQYTRVPIIKDEISIGRQEGNTVRLPDRNVSRRHCRLTRRATKLYLEDLGSHTGTRINGERIQGTVAIRTGDNIRIGDYHLTVKPLGPKPSAQQWAEYGNQSLASAPTPSFAVTAPSIFSLSGDPLKQGRLIVISTNFERQEFPLEKPATVIGRTNDNDIVLNHRSISRHHAKIVREGEQFHIVDMQSGKGVRVNGEPDGKAELRKGDLIDLGHVRLIFVPPGQDVDIRDKIVDLDSSSWFTWKWVAGPLMLAALAYGGYRWQKASMVPPALMDISQTVAGIAKDNWSEAKRKAQRVLADQKVSEMIKDAVRQKQSTIEQNQQAQPAFERFMAAAKAPDPDEALDLYARIPAGSLYRSQAEQTFNELLLHFRDVHLNRAQAACEAGLSGESQREVDKVLDRLPNQPDALRLNKRDCSAAKPAEIRQSK